MPKKLGGYLFFMVLFVFSSWLMIHTFSYDSKSHAMKIAGKVWSDFGGHLPLIRSFTYGRNWPPQNPLFPGEPIRYHFFFYFLVGLLERAGVRIDLALNSLSILGFFTTLVLIYLLAIKLFSHKAVGYLSILFFLFNGSLSFVKYFSKHGTFADIFTNSQYPSFGPWDGGPIAAIWNLNIFTNQRHLAFAMALALAVIYLLFHSPVSVTKKLLVSFVLSLSLGLLALSNQAIFASLGVFLLWFFLLYPSQRFTLLFCALFTLPWFFYSRSLVHLQPLLTTHPGFLLNTPLTPHNLLNFWFHNLGLHLVLAPLGILLAPPTARKLALPILTLFFIANYWQLSPDMFNNHKLINFIQIFIVMFTAHALIRIWTHHSLLRLYSLFLIFFLTLSGVIDFFALKNDGYLTLKDVQSDPDIQFFLDGTPPTAVVANSTWFFHPASLAGRAIFSGYTYFTWSHGYDQGTRENQLVAIYRAPDKPTACRLLRLYNISYLDLRDRPEDYLKPNFSLWQNEFIPVYSNPNSGLKVYETVQNCS